MWAKIDEGLRTLPVLDEGRTVQQIADALGVDRIYIARIERSAFLKMQPALQQFARDIGLKGEIQRETACQKLPNMKTPGKHQRKLSHDKNNGTYYSNAI